ncbi:hypothetical protein PT974_10523 [Cladobotryum mycophilum]|uniref:F-box domain-containing protein n=1 Tax=Cladobotryum mycophilum TaxID=491253 RepID=A0ABR0SB34_9HYPO
MVSHPTNAPADVTDYGLISRLSHICPEAEHHAGMIRVDESPKPSRITRDMASSIGVLDTFPVEVMHLILGEADFQSISRFSLTSLRAYNIVQTLHAYRDLMEYAPKALVALSRTRLIQYHSAATLHAALQSQACISCGEYGAYLFLPTCQRCCWWCLDKNRSLQVMPRGAAGICFSLTSRQLDELPTMLSLPGHYFHGHRDIRHKKRSKLVCVGAAKKRSLSIYGSEEEIARLPLIKRPRLSERRLYEYGIYQAASLEPSSQDPLMLPDLRRSMADPCGGMASICFPSLVHNRLETRLWCLGCDWLSDNHATRLTSPTISRLIPDNLNPDDVYRGMRLRARSRSNFLRHIKHCFGVRKVARRVGLGSWARGLTTRTAI